MAPSDAAGVCFAVLIIPKSTACQSQCDQGPKTHDGKSSYAENKIVCMSLLLKTDLVSLWLRFG